VPASIPIGTPITATQVYLLDPHGQPVPAGVPGELFIGGEGLARGYVRRPDLTAERFLPNPFSPTPGARMYRTGDLARWRHDGVLEFLGRTDFQVKIRGFRIELAEVEAALLAFPGVREAVALAREDVPGDKRLVGYLTADASLDLGALRAHLQGRLPEYMVPSALVRLDSFPLTANAKVDRKALPAPESRAELRAYVAPRTPTEQALASIWAEVLRVDKVGLQDSFFELGGHSLLATQLVARIRSAFNVELPLRALFEASSLEGLAARVDQAAQGASLPPLRPMPRKDAPLPLSFAQQRLWFLDQLQPGGIQYNMPTALRFDGALDVAAMERAFTELVRRHEALRTHFRDEGGTPVQLIAPPAPFHLPMVDLSSREDREAEARRLAMEEAGRAFDLTHGPLLRASLLRLSEQQHVLLLNVHHIVSDGWSMGVLVREMGMLYAACSSGQPSPLAELPVQYADYALWQRSWLHGDALAQQVSWWKQYLSGAPAHLELPTDFPRPPVLSPRGASVPVRLSRELSESLKALAQREGATPFMLLLASFQLLLSRYSGQDDVVVGTPIAGRRHAETEALIGFFVNTLVLRTHFDGQRTFQEVLAEVRKATLGAYEHQDVPFEKLVEELQPVRDLSRSALFQALFALQNAPVQDMPLPGLSLRPFEAEDTAAAKFELTLNLAESADGFGGSLQFSTDLFTQATAARMVRHLGALLEAAVTAPQTPVSALPLLSEAERQQLLVHWNDTSLGTDYPRESTLPDVFAQVVARHPDKVAVEFEDTKLTYRQLDAHSNRLAHHLRSLGVSTDARVAIAVERSLELVVALVGILKAGAAYVPLDPAYPRERLAAMVEDARPRVLITTGALLAKLPAEGLSTVLLEESSLAEAPAHAPPPAALPDSLAYIDFTSGSTGRPKGVGTTHRAVLRTFFGVDYAHFGPEETFLLNAPISFDASTLELWGALLHGARLVVMPPQPHSLEELGRTLQRSGVTTLWLTSGLFTQMVEGNLEGLRTVKQVLTGGDVVSAPHVRRVLEALPASVVNGYGPTESTVFATSHSMTAPSHAEGASLPIGRPLAHTRVYVLDAHGQPVPIGVPGELFIGGDGLARGYMEQPALTAERFVPNPFSSAPGARLYRTGDKARWRADGSLDYLGRLDFQVKLRGFRIELGEIEATLARHPHVREALVLVREDSPGDQRLVGYFTSQAQPLEPSALRAFLKEHLPEYMVPGALVPLEAFPLTPNGKVNRKALPAPEASLLASASVYVAPRTPTEERLASLWAEVLRVERVGIHDHFFELGGHSLLATQVVARIRSAFNIELPLRALFEAPTLEQLARRVEQTRTHAELPPLRPAPRDRLLPLSFAQQRLWFLDQLQPGSPSYNMPTALRLDGMLDVAALGRAFTELVRRHEALRTTFRDEGGTPVQLISPPAPFDLPVLDLSSNEDREARARLLAQQDAVRAFDLTRGPLLRASLLRLAEQQHVLLLNMHHVVSDGWSMGVLVSEIGALYQAFSAGRPSSLPELPVQYADFAVWQRSWLHGDTLDRQVSWWKQQLSGAPHALELPTDFPRPPVQSFRGGLVSFRLSPQLGRSLEALSQKEGATLFMALLAS
ncbi:non-ribosomal peptide synthetase, partial [Pyxidicoccus trucidator]|uniref:non-ribosomal peptide synthetase n=1 Tax=Pyxidicoccus trucidator TaxID=2709662 RepID=UPI0013DCD583